MTSMILVLQGVSEVSMSEKVDPVIDCIFMNYRLYMLFQYARYNILHINNVAAEKIDMGFTSLEHMGIPVYLDKNCPQDKVYFIDSSQIKLLYVEGENFKRTVKEIPNKFAKQYFTSFIGNYIIEKARNCGVITIVDGTTPETIPDTANVCMPSKFVDADYKQPAETINPDDTENKGYSGSGVKVNVTSTTASNRNKK
jgi:hypothetical protein